MKRKLKTLLGRTNVVGVINTDDDLKLAHLFTHCVDIFEWRVDKLFGDVEKMDEIKSRLRNCDKPVIVTVRAYQEGGAQQAWGTDDRLALYRQCMDVATLVDVEASTADDMAGTLALAKRHGVGIIISSHCLKGTLTLNQIDHAAHMCREVGGHILKLAFQIDNRLQFENYLRYVGRITRCSNVPVAAMAMGRFGKLSRLIFGMLASPLVYGYLKDAQVTGQWHVTEIKPMIEKVSG